VIAGLALRVLDLAGAPGVFCGRLFVGLGAEVLRVEPPGGDPLRVAPPDGLAFVHASAGKRSVVLDLEHGAGRARLRELAAAADVLIDTAPPGRLDALGLGYATLAAAQPGLVQVSITPFGLTGPRAAWAGTDLTAVALGGMMGLGGHPDGPPLAPPREQAYHLAGVAGATGALLALRARRRTGRGQRVDVSIQEVVAATLEYGVVAYVHQGVVHRRRGSRYPHVLHGLFRAADGAVAGGVSGSPRMWHGLLDWMREAGQGAELDAPHWADETVRLAERERLFAIVERFTRTFTKDAFCAEARRRRLPWAPVAETAEVAASPQLAARRFFVDVELESGAAVPDTGFAFAFPEGHRPARLRVPACGEGNDARPWRAAAPPAGPGPAAGHRGALAGTRVLDLTWVLAGPYATKILADHGAEVVKVESRHRPDASRFAAALHFSRDPARHPDTSGYFNNFNRNKRSVALNLDAPGALDVLRGLCRVSDVVIENFSAGVMGRWGLDHGGLRALRPDAILVSMAGMGHTGPWRDHVTYADAVMAIAGLTGQMGFPGRELAGFTFGLGDMIAGAHAALGALAALEYRDATGRGQHVDLSQVEAVASHLGTSVLELSATGCRPAPQGNRHPAMAPHGAFRCRGEDRWVALAVADDAGWRALCGLMERPDLAADARYATLAGRQAHADALEREVAAWTGRLDAEDAMARCQAAGIPAGVVQDARDLVEGDPQLRARGFYQPVAHPAAGTFLHEGVVPRLADTPGAIWHAAPRLGEHTRDVLRDWLGLGEGEMDKLAGDGVLQ
jgi:crotonobetainyl-CoA:carnitine CoA-transferase CaiB-like acyl-CoA transferase